MMMKLMLALKPQMRKKMLNEKGKKIPFFWIWEKKIKKNEKVDPTCQLFIRSCFDFLFGCSRRKGERSKLWKEVHRISTIALWQLDGDSSGHRHARLL